jgi:hypothetical protein
MRKLLGVAVALLAVAAPSPAQTTAGPALEVRIRSVNDLTDRIEYLGDVVNQPESARQFAGFVQSLATEKKGIKGLDPARPIGLYGSVTKDVVNSPVVLLAPILDQQALLDFLSGEIGLNPTKGDDGAYQLDIPNVPVPIFFRFANKYVYITVRDTMAIEPKKLLDPKTFFAGGDDSVASARLHLDRLPADVKKTVFGQFELKMNDAKDKKESNETPAQRKLRLWLLDQVTAVAKSVVTDGEELGVRLRVEPKTDDLSAAWTLSAKAGSPLAQWIRGLSGQPGVASALVTDQPAAFVGVKLKLPIDARLQLDPIIDALAREVVAQTKDDVKRQVTRLVADAVVPTLKAGQLDLGLLVTGPDSAGRFTLVSALRVAEGKGLEKLLKQFAPFIPEQQAKFTFDVKKVGRLTVHRCTVANADLKAVFGSETIWLGVSDDYLLVSIEPEGVALTAVAEKLTKNESTVRPIAVELSAARLSGLAAQKQLTANRIKELIRTVYPNGAVGKDTFRLTVEGDNALKLRINLKGKAIKVVGLFDQEKKK